MASLECQCTEYMSATCDMPDSDWGTLLVCVGVIFLILRHLNSEIWTFSISEIDLHDDGHDHTHGGAEIEMGSQKIFVRS